MSVIPLFLLWMAGPSADYVMSYSWHAHGARQRATVSVLGPESPKYTCRFSFALPNGQNSMSTVRADDGPLNSRPQSRAFPVSAASRLIELDLSIPNWERTTFWLAGGKETTPVVFKFRDLPSNVFRFLRTPRGEVAGFMFFDRWVGGKPLVVTVRGKRLDRWEEVTTYRIGSNGLRMVGSYRRLVSNKGGGAHERTYRRIAGGH